MRDIATASDRDGQFLDTLRRHLRARGTRAWRQAWSSSGELGTVAVPALEGIWRKERNPLERLAVLAAIDFASGPHGDFLLERLEKTRETDEQAFLMLCLAIGPERTDPKGVVAEFLRSTKPVLRIAACLAGKRLSLQPPDAFYGENDPGVAAAARYCAPRSEDPGMARWLRKRSPAHADLVRRGALLGVGRRADLAASVEDDIVQVLASGRDGSVPDSAAIAAMRALDVGALRDLESSISESLVPLLAFAPHYRSGLHDALARILDANRVSLERRQRAAVCLAASAPADLLARVANESRNRSPDVEVAFLLGLAHRLFVRPDEVEAFRNVEFEGRAAASWVRLARGESLQPVSFGDVGLTRAFELARVGEMPRSACADAIELALWRTGAHPGRSAFDAERRFVHDLLVRGSEYARHVRGSEPGENHYFPRGLPASAAMFEVALEYYSFVTATARYIPDRHRLR